MTRRKIQSCKLPLLLLAVCLVHYCRGFVLELPFHARNNNAPSAITTTTSLGYTISTTSINDAPIHDSHRRSLVTGTLASLAAVLLAPPTPAMASEVRGPLELLRPAIRVKLYIDQAIQIAQEATAKTKTTQNTKEQLLPLRDFFQAQPSSFLTPDEAVLSKRYLEIDTSSAWQNARRKELEQKGKEYGIDYTTPYDQFNTAVQQWGDKRTFQRLRQKQVALESQNGIRAALNAYTNNLVFGDSYQLNAEGDLKKNLIRQDALPNVNAVVVSDLDLRDLVRNQILQNMDDAKAELEYQLTTTVNEKEKEEEIVDVQEILTYLQAARASCDEWLSFIPPEDVKAALDAVLAEDTTSITASS